MQQYSDDELIAQIERQESQSYQPNSGTLKEERERSLEYYLGEPYGNEVQDRSQVVTRETLEVVESVLPFLLKTFTSGDEVVSFAPTDETDIPQAEQETEYVNFVVTKKNPWFQICHTWFKDALLEKVGYVKVFWEEKEEYNEERYEGLSEDELAFILADRDVEIIEQDAVLGLNGIVYSVKLKQLSPCKQVRIENLPPEEVFVSMRTRSVNLQDSPFVQHRCYKTVSDLRAAGYKLDMTKLASYEDIESEVRDIYDEQDYQDDAAEENKLVLVRESWLMIDDDKDGVAELKRVLIAGTQVLEREPADFVPVVAICPVPMPHRHIGLSEADLVMDLQLLKSTVTRQILDNMYLSNNVRHAVDPNRVNLDDFLVSRPGGVVRTMGDPAGAIMPLVNPAMYSGAFPMLEYLDSMRETRTGITRYNQGLDASSLNKTASGITQIMSASQQRLDMVARLFAENGVKPLFEMVHALVRKYSDNQEIIKLRNQYVPVDPRGWRKRVDMTISVGLGTGNKDQMLQHLMMILQAQREAFQIGLANPKNIHYALTKMTENAGFKDADQFWANPEEAGAQQPQIPPEVQQQMQQVQEHIAQLTEENQKLQQEIAKRDADTSVEVYKVDKQTEADLMKAQMQNESKEMIASMQAITDAIMKSQQEITGKVEEMEDREEVDLTPVMEALQALQAQIQGTQPVGIKQIRDESGRLVGGVRILADGSQQEISIQ